MKMIFADDAGTHLGCLEFDGDQVTIEKYKKEFSPQIVDAQEMDDKDETEGPYAKDAMAEGEAAAHEMAESPSFEAGEDEDETEKKKRAPMKGLFS